MDAPLARMIALPIDTIQQLVYAGAGIEKVGPHSEAYDPVRMETE